MANKPKDFDESDSEFEDLDESDEFQDFDEFEDYSTPNFELPDFNNDNILLSILCSIRAQYNTLFSQYYAQ